MLWLFEEHSILASLFIITGILLVWNLRNTLFPNKDQTTVWASLEAVGVPSNGIFPWARAIIASIVSLAENAQEGYENICKKQNLPFALPSIWVGGALVVLPSSLLHLLNRPEKELSGFKSKLENIQLPYMISDPDIYLNVIQFDVARKMMGQVDILDEIARTTAEEIDLAFRGCWGTSKQWATVNGWDVCGRIVTQAALRTMIGLSLCRHEALLEQSRLFANSVFSGTAIINCLPPFVRPLLGPLFALKAKYHESQCQKILVPIIEERIRLLRSGEKGHENDFLQWMILRCAEDPEQMKPKKIVGRLLILNTLFIFGIGFVFAQCVLDIYGSPSTVREEVLAGLGEECKRVSMKYQGLATKEAVDSLFRLDSTLRESMRMSDAGVVSLFLEVVTGKVDLGHGIHIPPGIRMVFPSQPIHVDPDNYKDPLQFDAFRFSRKFETLDPNEQSTAAGRELVTVLTKSFLAFGYGRHGCPGRWFVAQTIKQTLAHMILNYDVEYAGKPTKRKAVLNMMVPPTDAQIKIRRKSRSKGEESHSATVY